MAAMLFLLLIPAPAHALSADQLERGQEAVTRLNLHRRMCGLTEVTLDMTLSEGCVLHAAYLNSNPDQIFGGLDAHDEFPERPGFTPAGAQAGKNGDIHFGATAADSIDCWIQTYYHRNPMMSPGVKKVGYGDSPGENVGFAISVLQFEAYTGPGDVLSPGDRSDGNANAGYFAGETPSPIPGFGKNTGNPIIAYFSGIRVTWTGSTITTDGIALPHQIIAPNKPSNTAFEVNEICLITDSPLPIGSLVSVEIRYQQGSAKVIRWTFRTSASGPFDPASAVAAGAGTPSADTDGDGFFDEIEVDGGTSFQDPASTPFSGKPAGTPVDLPVAALSIKLNFAFSNSDSIVFSGWLPIPDGFSFSGQPVIVFCGGIAKTFTLDANGKTPRDRNTFKLGKPKKGMSKFSAKLSGGNFRAALQDEGLRNADEQNVPKTVTLLVLFNQTLFSKDQPQTYTAKANKIGKSR